MYKLIQEIPHNLPNELIHNIMEYLNPVNKDELVTKLKPYTIASSDPNEFTDFLHFGNFDCLFALYRIETNHTEIVEYGTELLCIQSDTFQMVRSELTQENTTVYLKL